MVIACSDATPWGRYSCKRELVQRLEATGDVDATKARWKPGAWTKDGGAAARWGDGAAARCSIGGRRVLGDVLGVDAHQVG